MHLLRKPWVFPFIAFVVVLAGSWWLAGAPLTARASAPLSADEASTVDALSWDWVEAAAEWASEEPKRGESVPTAQEPDFDHTGLDLLTGPFDRPQDVTEACIECHFRAGEEVMATIHWTWDYVDPITGQHVGKNNVINSYCMGVPSNEPRCTSCHAGYGYADQTFFETATEEDVDCLVCHDTTGAYKKFPTAAGYPVLDEPREFPPGSGRIWEPVDLTSVAQKVGRPDRANCGSCHFFGGGGDAVKHGDLDSTLLEPTRELDVHMATNGLDFSCATCHAEDDHVIAGRMYNGEERVLCEDCHSGEQEPHQESEMALTMHTEDVACQTCHIPSFARGQATKMSWDWSTAGDMNDEGQPYTIKNEAGQVIYDSKKGSFTWAQDVIPRYQWWNGNTYFLTVESEIDPTGVVTIADFEGEPGDGRIYPFKHFTGTQPYDAGNNTLVIPNLFPNNASDTNAYWRGWDWDNAVSSGMSYADAQFSGELGWVDTEMSWVQNHMVAPSEDALTCVDCHTEGSRMDFLLLDYEPERAAFLQRLFEPGQSEQPHQDLTKYVGPETCLTCHAEDGMEVAASLHYRWPNVEQSTEGAEEAEMVAVASEYCDTPATADINWLDLVQSQDESRPAQSTGCAQYHVGFGPKPNPLEELTTEDAQNVDCLLCHGPNYTRTVEDVDGDLRWVAAEDVNVIEVVQNVQRPTNDMCQRCHLGLSSGTTFKHGEASISAEGDVHFAAGVQCVDCHQVDDHSFGGADIEATDTYKPTAGCTDCHDRDHPIGFTAIDRHLDRVACQTCHIPALARDADQPTVIQQDWTASEISADGLYAPATVSKANVMPVYRWWDGTVEAYPPTVVGAKDEDVKLYPWKHVESVVPVDAETGAFTPLKLDTFYTTGDLDAAITEGVELTGADYSGSWEAKTDELLLSLNHQVAPADEALRCPDCHTREEGRLDFEELGFTKVQAADLVRASNAEDVESREPFGGGTTAREQTEKLDYIVEPEALAQQRDATQMTLLGVLGGVVLGLVLAAVLALLMLRSRGVTHQEIIDWLREHRFGITAVVIVIVVVGLGGFLSIHYLFEFTASVEFCGEICHATRPEYVTYHTSLHANVACVECHVGPGLGAELKAKMNGIRELYLQVTNSYERPIPSPVETLRPAREVCEHCHWPQMFYADRSIEIPHFANDEENSRTNTYMLVKIGGGTERMGQGQGIHWHIENKVEYIATDPQRQNIPWVRAELGGETLTFVDVTNPLSEADLAQYEIREMDCIDCHNRASHIFRSADELLDEAMANGLLPTDLPYLRREAFAAMDQPHDFDEAMHAIEAMPAFYEEYYPDIYETRQEQLGHIVEELKDMYAASHFPEAEVDHTTYPDNLAHSEDPGCFRCHDGKHYVEGEGDKSIRLHCTICHTIPQTVAAGEPAPEVPFQSAWQPDNHLSSTWIADHRYTFDETCNDCHEEESFCANANCHGRAWPYVDLSVSTPPFPLPEE